MASKIKHPVRWAAKSSYGGKHSIHPYYTRATRKEAINSIVDNLGGRYTWRQLKKQGWSVVKVYIVEVTPTAGRRG